MEGIEKGLLLFLKLHRIQVRLKERCNQLLQFFSNGGISNKVAGPNNGGLNSISR